jgi:hypothetical protein
MRGRTLRMAGGGSGAPTLSTTVWLGAAAASLRGGELGAMRCLWGELPGLLVVLGPAAAGPGYLIVTLVLSAGASWSACVVCTCRRSVRPALSYSGALVVACPLSCSSADQLRTTAESAAILCYTHLQQRAGRSPCLTAGPLLLPLLAAIRELLHHSHHQPDRLPVRRGAATCSICCWLRQAGQCGELWNGGLLSKPHNLHSTHSIQHTQHSAHSIQVQVNTECTG